MNKNKTLDFMIASEIFLLAILEFVSWRFCISENYICEIKGSNYLITLYPLLCTLGFLYVGLCKLAKSYRFKVCIYTKIVSWLFFILQIFNLLSLFFFEIELYNVFVIPIFTLGIISLIITKSIIWGLSKR